MCVSLLISLVVGHTMCMQYRVFRGEEGEKDGERENERERKRETNLTVTTFRCWFSQSERSVQAGSQTCSLHRLHR